MPHFLIKKEEIKDNIIELIDNENLFHLIKVLRVKQGQKVKFIDLDKNVYFCEIKELSKNSLKAQIIEIKVSDRVLKNDVHIFAPQLLLWSDEYDVKFDRQVIDGQLKRVGSSITAIELFGITRILDYFEQKDYVSSFGMVGLSYGGFYTLYTTAIDTRIKSALSCSFFNKRDAVGWQDWVWFKSAEKFDDAEVACLIYPRNLYIEIGDKDELFDYKNGEESFEKIKTMCEKVGTDWVYFKVFGGTHEFCLDDEPIQKLVNDIQ